MQLETFRGRDLHGVMRQVRRALGEDAMIVRTRVVSGEDGRVVEVTATSPETLEAFRRRIDGGLAAALRARGRSRIGPYTVALAGPAGAGKTTTAVKLALHPRGLGGRKVGLVTLDTYRVGGIEEAQTYAEIADLPLEVVYHPREVEAARERLRAVDVILVDCPGRAPTDEPTGWVAALRAFDPDETHLVIPAGLRPDVARGLAAGFAAVEPTHALFTRADELSEDRGLATLAEAVGLPTRWITDGPDVPAALAPSGPRIMAALGSDVDERALRAG